MPYLMIENGGEVETSAMHLLGASTKRDDETKIGMFGSGFKYALAWLLRNNYEVLIFSGRREITIGTTERQFRNQTFNVITIDGEATSLTTDLGPKWQLWQVIREIYSNAVDEEDYEVEKEWDLSLYGVAGRTRIFIRHTSELKLIIQDWDDYFLNTKSHRKMVQTPDGDLYTGAGFFRRGIRISAPDSELQPSFLYNFFSIGINEERLAGDFDIMSSMMLVWMRVDDPLALLRFIKACTVEDSAEAKAVSHYSYYFNDDIAPILGKEIEGKYVGRGQLGNDLITVPDDVYILPDSLANWLFKHKVKDWFLMKGYRRDGLEIMPIPEAYQRRFEITKSFLEGFGYRFDFPINFARPKYDTDKRNSHLYALKLEDNSVALLDKAFESEESLVASLIEEFTHIEHATIDGSRAHQNALLRQLTSVILHKSIKTVKKPEPCPYMIPFLRLT